MVLKGTEIKSLRQGHGSLSESFMLLFKMAKLYIYGFNISQPKEGNIFNHDPLRPRKLLMHKLEILRYAQAVEKRIYCCCNKMLYKNGLCQTCYSF